MHPSAHFFSETGTGEDGAQSSGDDSAAGEYHGGPGKLQGRVGEMSCQKFYQHGESGDLQHDDHGHGQDGTADFPVNEIAGGIGRLLPGELQCIVRIGKSTELRLNGPGGESFGYGLTFVTAETA